MAGNYRKKHPDGENLDLTDAQKSAVDQIRELLDTLPPERGEVFQEYLKGLTDGEKGSEEIDGKKNKGSDSAIDARSDSAGD